MSLTYPPTKTIPHTDDYHGTRVADPYRWLEDLDSPETRAWIAAQNELTNAYLAPIPQRKKIRARLTELWNFPRVNAPFKRGGRYFQFRNTGLQNFVDGEHHPPVVRAAIDGALASTATRTSTEGGSTESW